MKKENVSFIYFGNAEIRWEMLANDITSGCMSLLSVSLLCVYEIVHCLLWFLISSPPGHARASVSQGVLIRLSASLVATFLIRFCCVKFLKVDPLWSPVMNFFLPSVLECLPWILFRWVWPLTCYTVAFADCLLWTDLGLLITNTSTTHLSVSLHPSLSMWTWRRKLTVPPSPAPLKIKHCHQGNQIRSTLFVYPELYTIRD